MKEYVDREAAIRAIRENTLFGAEYWVDCPAEELVAAINKIPAADVIEAKAIEPFVSHMSLFCAYLAEKIKKLEDET